MAGRDIHFGKPGSCGLDGCLCLAEVCYWRLYLQIDAALAPFCRSSRRRREEIARAVFEKISGYAPALYADPAVRQRIREKAPRSWIDDYLEEASDVQA